MSQSNLMSICRNIFGRMFIVYFLMGLVFMTFNHKSTLKQAKLKTLNRLMPPLDVFVKSSLDGSILEENDLDAYVFYYQKVSEVMPKNANAHYVRGYCLTLQGNFDRAVKAYKRSIELNPHFFWAHYNLGLIYLKNSDPDQAADAFRLAIKAKPDVSLKIIVSSKVFQQLILQFSDSGNVLTRNIKRGYADTQKLLPLSELLKSKAVKQMPEALKQQLPARLF